MSPLRPEAKDEAGVLALELSDAAESGKDRQAFVDFAATVPTPEVTVLAGDPTAESGKDSVSWGAPLNPPSAYPKPAPVAEACGWFAPYIAQREQLEREVASLRESLDKYHNRKRELDQELASKLDDIEQLRTRLTAATARAEAAEAKVRDVETLDEWCGAAIKRLAGIYSFKGAFEAELEEDCATLHYNKGASPTEARAKAAQWVRENSPPQKKPTDEGGRGEDAGGVVK